MYKTNYVNNGEISHSRDCMNVYENRKNKKRNHLYKALTDDSFVDSLGKLFKALLSIMLVTLSLASFVGIGCCIVMLILNVPMAALALLLTVLVFIFVTIITAAWFGLIY